MPDPTDEARELAMQFRLPGELTMSRMHCEALAALIAKARTEAERWQPIETAPKDGTHVLLANKAGASEGGWLSDIDHGADWEGQIGMAGWWRADGTDWPCTHWQPLPVGPGASPAEAERPSLVDCGECRTQGCPKGKCRNAPAQPVAPAGQAAAGVQGEVVAWWQQSGDPRFPQPRLFLASEFDPRGGAWVKGVVHRPLVFGDAPAPAVERGVTIERSVAQEIRETLSTYVTTYNDCWERGMDILEPMGDKALALLDAALSTAGKEQA